MLITKTKPPWFQKLRRVAVCSPGGHVSGCSRVDARATSIATLGWTSFLVIHILLLPYVAIYGSTLVSCQLGCFWLNPCVVEGGGNTYNLQSQKLRTVHPRFATYVHKCSSHCWRKCTCCFKKRLFTTCQDIWNISHKVKWKTMRAHPTYSAFSWCTNFILKWAYFQDKTKVIRGYQGNITSGQKKKWQYNTNHRL